MTFISVIKLLAFIREPYMSVRWGQSLSKNNKTEYKNEQLNIQHSYNIYTILTDTINYLSIKLLTI